MNSRFLSEVDLPMPLPLSRMSDEELAAIGGLVFDVDDTVTRHGRVEAIAFDALWRLADAGLRLIAVTGRPLGWTDVLARMWPVDLAVGENGAGWAWVRDGAMREGYFERENTRAQQAERLDSLRRRVQAQMPAVTVASDQRARRCDVAFDIGETVQLEQAEIDRLHAVIIDAGLRCTISSVHAHAIPGNWDKAKGTAAAARAVLGVELADEPDRWLFVGDSGNDEAAFGFFPLSVGVANVAPWIGRMQTPPRHVTDADRGRGFAEVADRLLATRGAPR